MSAPTDSLYLLLARLRLFLTRDQALEKMKDLTLLSDIFPTGYHGAVRAGVTTGSTVYVAGAGPVGLACAASAKLLGASVVIVGDMIPERLAQACSFGCETIDIRQGHIVDQIKQILGTPEVDCAVDCVGFEARYQHTLLHARGFHPLSDTLQDRVNVAFVSAVRLPCVFRRREAAGTTTRPRSPPRSSTTAWPSPGELVISCFAAAAVAASSAPPPPSSAPADKQVLKIASAGLAFFRSQRWRLDRNSGAVRAGGPGCKGGGGQDRHPQHAIWRRAPAPPISHLVLPLPPLLKTFSALRRAIPSPPSPNLPRLPRPPQGWAKSLTFVTGQCPVMKYNRQLMAAILKDRVQIAKAVNVQVLSLDDAPKGYKARTPLIPPPTPTQLTIVARPLLMGSPRPCLAGL